MGASFATPVENLRNKEWVEKHGHTVSIMDYARFNYVAQPEDNISRKGLFPRINDYDLWAIKWGYSYRPEFKKEYEEKSAKGEYSRKSRIDAQNKLKRLEVGKDFTKETRDLYGLGKDDLRNLIESSEDGNKVLDNVIAYGDALVRAGITSRNKFRDRYGNVSLSGTSRSGRSGGSRSRSGTISYKMDTMSLIRGALKSSRSKSSVSFNRKTATKANTRAIKRLKSSKIKR